jgi:SAM-dependent methyltransferase
MEIFSNLFIKEKISFLIKKFLCRFIKSKVTKARKESNLWLKIHASNIKGSVLSIGAGTDQDKEGGYYREYFKSCSSYTTLDIEKSFGCDITLDARFMPEICDESFDCVFCSGVLEHIDDYLAALKEISRILKIGGILLLGLPFRQAIHSSPHDYWRFTEYGIRYLLGEKYEILNLTPIDESIKNFPAAYWVKAKKIK